MIKHGKCIQNGLFNKKVKIAYYKRKYMLLLLLLYKSYIIYVMLCCVIIFDLVFLVFQLHILSLTCLGNILVLFP